MRTRNVQIKFFLSAEEVEFLEKKMQVVGIRNRSTYIRKMVLDGYIIHQDFSVLKEFTIALDRIGNNLNQIAKVANTYGEVSLSELQEIRDKINNVFNQIIKLIYIK